VNRVLTRAAQYAVLAVAAVFFVLPVLWTLLTSLKPDLQLRSIPPTIVPSPPTLENYTGTGGGLLVYLRNSVVASVVATAVSLLLSIPAAYGFARFPYRFSGGVFGAIVICRFVPTIVLSIPYFLMMSRLGLLDTLLGLVAVYVPLQTTLMVWLLESFFRQVPRELEEAAQIDGLGVVGRLVRIVIPLTLPSLAVATILGFLASWNEFLLANTLGRTTASQTMPVGIASFVTSFQTDWGQLTANGILYMLPVMAVTLAAQRGLISGLTQGALKG